MNPNSTPITYDVQLQPGESLALPAEISEITGPGHWQIIIQPAAGVSPSRDHTAFLNSYVPEDEELYDDQLHG